MKCQSCGNDNLTEVLSLGYLPPVNDMRPIGEEPKPQTWLPADLLYCDQCELVQLGCVGDPNVVFPPSYPYTSGSTRILRDNFADLAKEATELVGLKPNDLVVDIGSNDGTLLSNFKGHTRICGIEPTDIADVANARGIHTIKAFFDGKISMDGQAKLVTCANCFAHMDNIHDVIEGIKQMLTPDGVFVSESHYLMALLDDLQYDTIYHEHLRYYSLTSLRNLLRQHGLEVFYAKKIPTHGGSI
ncbi:MAG TPA: methyltransferase domain-containing protein, partial [Anaerolineae bacterium]|nr:methyltransferase domain-containing protein [Anaerolineae bacterium]